MPNFIFYSWQSDLPNNTNRGLIERALEKASKAVQSDPELVVDPVIDRDTANVSGAPDIGATIFDKIDRASVFVADVSIINRKFRSSPNPNVLIELGYALKALGWQRVVLVANTNFGAPDELPFDLRQRRVLTYHSAPGDSSRKDGKDHLALALERAIRPILALHDSRRGAEVDQKLARLEFLHDCSRPLRDLGIDLRLSRALSPVELGHFRLLLSIVAPGRRDAYSKLEIVVRDDPSKSQAMNSGEFWITVVENKRGRFAPKRQIYYKFSGLLGEEILFISARGGFSEWTSGFMPTATLGDLDENLLGVFVTNTLAPLVADIRIVANGYTLLQVPAEDITIYEDDWADLLPMELSDEEKLVPWVRLDHKGGVIRLDFASSTPLHLFSKGEFTSEARDNSPHGEAVQPHAAPGADRVKRGQRR